ncbi:MAG: tyrosine-type recombinase/integrase [Clostridiales bacterium]|nr:tyrosine-type recombinase/integrase [Clostridiales bacterium]
MSILLLSKIDHKGGQEVHQDKNGSKFVSEKHDRTYRLKFPKITPHVCRHTFCSNMARSGMNPKTLQYIMGHSDITVTMNTYTHVKYDDAKEEFARVTAIG